MTIRHIKVDEYPIIKQDPVRPHIPLNQRISNGSEIYVMKNGKDIDAVLCVSYMNQVPSNEEDLRNFSVEQTGGNIAVFYTVWSNKKGMGRKMVLQGIDMLKKTKPHLNRFVTLSPITQMASKFHLKNGAKLINTTKGYVKDGVTVQGYQNFEYGLPAVELDPEERDWEYDGDGLKIYKPEKGFGTKTLWDNGVALWNKIFGGKS